MYFLRKIKCQTNDGTITSINAGNMTFDEWVEHCFSSPQEVTHISNAQTRMLGAAYRQKPLIRRTSNGMEYDIHQAIRNIESVKLLARTEFFNEDVGRFSEMLRPYGIEFNFSKIEPQNTTSKNHHKSIDDRLDNVKQLLVGDNYQKLLDANKQDLLLFDYASSIIEQEKMLNAPVDSRGDQ